MAFETLYSTIANERMAAVLGREVLMLLAARGALPAHPSLIFGGDIGGSGSSQILIPQVGLGGYNLMSAVADGASVLNTAITDAVATLAPTRYALSREPSDLAKWTDPGNGMINPAAFAQDAAASWDATMLFSLSQMGASASTFVGSTGVDLTIAQHLSAVIALEQANTPGPYLAVYHGIQVGDLKTAVSTTSGGALQWLPESASLVQSVGNGAKGSYLGADILQSNHVPSINAGADRGGFMMGRGSIAWGTCTVQVETADQVALGPYLLFERARDSKAGLTSYVTSAFLAFVECIDAAYIGVRSDL